MAIQAIIPTNRIAADPGSIQASITYLEQQTWWPRFRDTRRSCTRQLDDVLWVGHFCGWLQRQRLAIERCTKSDLDAYLLSIASFRPGPRSACERTVTALVEFLGNSSLRGC